MHKQKHTVAISEKINEGLKEFLIRHDRQEDLAFALWTPSIGENRLTALLHAIVFPQKGDRQIHGNASFNPAYFDRVCKLALQEKCGIAFLHSHPFPGWQGMSDDDIIAERKMAGATHAITDLPLLGMTVGSDGIWSGRFWKYSGNRQYNRVWCHSVRVVGKSLKVNFNKLLEPETVNREYIKRTVSVWGEKDHIDLIRLRIGIIGLGSVGSMIAETLSRMGMKRFTLIDFDEIQAHNLDRLLGATTEDIGMLKVAMVDRQIKRSTTATNVDVNTVPFSLAEKEGYKAALDCDVLFSCVDRPRARHILNHFAYAHLIPVIDGGIDVRFNKKREFTGVDWQLQTVAPGRPCLKCIGAYDINDVSLEENGLLEDPSYMKNLPDNHHLKRNENVFPFSANLASLETVQFVALVIGAGGISDFGIQRYRYWPGTIDVDIEKRCSAECDCEKFVGQGDRYFSLIGRDLNAESARKRQLEFIN
ncbi:MAG: ThiF family adenylyltransferase [Pseudomonadota bacterium]